MLQTEQVTAYYFTCDDPECDARSHSYSYESLAREEAKNDGWSFPRLAMLDYRQGSYCPSCTRVAEVLRRIADRGTTETILER